jgi:hypothetical protein
MPELPKTVEQILQKAERTTILEADGKAVRNYIEGLGTSPSGAPPSKV